MSITSALILVSLGFALCLFGVAFWAELASDSTKRNWRRSPWIYTLSLSIYCTAWTFYGAVGMAHSRGLEFMAIYLGPTFVMIGWYYGVRHIVRMGRMERSTSIADFLSSRYGKSNVIAGAVTLIALIGITPYIALQLQSVARSFTIFTQYDPTVEFAFNEDRVAAVVAIGLGLFSILFGTRRLEAQERRHGVVMAVALEAVIKFIALISVGMFVIWGMSQGWQDTVTKIAANPVPIWPSDGQRWMVILTLSTLAFVSLPRVFHVMVVENETDAQLATASWAFPLYLSAMSIFVLPIAVWGRALLPAGSNPDFFVLSIPLEQGQNALAMLAYLGGFSSATSMVVVATLAISTMVSNHLILPVVLAQSTNQTVRSGDLRRLALNTRRLSIVALISMGYLYYRLSGGGAALASIGLISFAGMSQVMPALIIGMLWPRATRKGALAGISAGFIVWAYTMFLPSLGPDVAISATVLTEGPWGMDWLRPHGLLGFEFSDATVHASVMSLSVNILTILVASPLTTPKTPRPETTEEPAPQKELRTQDLLLMAQRVLGSNEARQFFEQEAKRQKKLGYLPDATPRMLLSLEREMAGAIGAATAHAMVAQTSQAHPVTADELMAVADETAQIIEYSRKLETQSQELESTAQELRDANQKLTRLSAQKDAFLSQISHELRTPMTSIRAYAELLKSPDIYHSDAAPRFAGIVHQETLRLSTLLDDLLDLSVLEHGKLKLEPSEIDLDHLMTQAIHAGLPQDETPIDIRMYNNTRGPLITDANRLTQVAVNLISNAAKYCDAEDPRLTITAKQTQNRISVDFHDNGSGIRAEDRDFIFEKFTRLSPDDQQGGVGLGLAICAQTMASLGGSIALHSTPSGTCFRIILPNKLTLD